MSFYVLVCVCACVCVHLCMCKRDRWLSNNEPVWFRGSLASRVKGLCMKTEVPTESVMSSSLTTEVEAVTHAIQWLASKHDALATIILTDSMKLLQKVESGMGCPNWLSHAQFLASVDLLPWAHWSQWE